MEMETSLMARYIHRSARYTASYARLDAVAAEQIPLISTPTPYPGYRIQLLHQPPRLPMRGKSPYSHGPGSPPTTTVDEKFKLANVSTDTCLFPPTPPGFRDRHLLGPSSAALVFNGIDYGPDAVLPANQSKATG